MALEAAAGLAQRSDGVAVESIERGDSKEAWDEGNDTELAKKSPGLEPAIL